MCVLFFQNHTVQRRRPEHACTLTPDEYTYANPTPMSTFEGLSTGRSEDSRSHHWRLVVDGNVAYHLTCNTGKSQKNTRKRCQLKFSIAAIWCTGTFNPKYDPKENIGLNICSDPWAVNLNGLGCYNNQYKGTNRGPRRVFFCLFLFCPRYGHVLRLMGFNSFKEFL